MNGQELRLEAARQIIVQCGIKRIVETGTHLGDTSDWFARFGLPVVTMEINPRWAEFSRLRLHKYRNVTVREGHSVDVLRNLATEQHNSSLPTFFYLDAHWLEHLPLREEVELIVKHFPQCVILIDDFEVPDDAGYGFDNYGAEKRISLSYLGGLRETQLIPYFPSERSEKETGRKRGWVVLTSAPKLSAFLDSLPHLRRYKVEN
jgi:hypothetical protein